MVQVQGCDHYFSGGWRRAKPGFHIFQGRSFRMFLSRLNSIFRVYVWSVWSRAERQSMFHPESREHPHLLFPYTDRAFHVLGADGSVHVWGESAEYSLCLPQKYPNTENASWKTLRQPRHARRNRCPANTHRLFKPPQNRLVTSEAPATSSNTQRQVNSSVNAQIKVYIYISFGPFPLAAASSAL